MNCVEFERVLPEFLEGAHTSEQQSHLNTCPACSSLVADLDLISAQAKTLVAAEEPSPAVWNALEVRLREEGLIRDGGGIYQVEPVRSKASWFGSWRTAWMMPVAAALVIVAGVKLYHPPRAGDNAPIAKNAPATAPRVVAAKTPASREDQQLLNSVVAHIPAQKARYSADLDDANSFIRDAEQSMKDDPNDIYTQQMLINAYAQKQMLYDLAVNHSSALSEQ